MDEAPEAPPESAVDYDDELTPVPVDLSDTLQDGDIELDAPGGERRIPMKPAIAAMLIVSLTGVLLGQVLGEALGRGYESQDRGVLETGYRLLNQLELHVYRSRDVGWCLTSKFPLVDRDGNTIGLVGVSQDLRLPDVTADEFRRQMAINFDSAFYCCQRAIPLMLGRPGVKKIVNISSNGAYNFDVFDPAHYRIVVFDQRGAGRSTPLGAVALVTGLLVVGVVRRRR